MGEAELLYQTLTDPTEFASMLPIMDKWGNETYLKHNRVQRHFLRNCSYGTPTIDLVVKPRQVTMTTGIIGEQLRNCLVDVTRQLTLMDTKDKTLALRLVIEKMYNGLPDYFIADGMRFRRPQRTIAHSTLSHFDNGSRWALGTAGSLAIGRSTTYDIMVGSEVAFWENAAKIVQGAQQAARFAKWRVYESTTNGAAGWFFEAVQQGLSPKNSIYKVHFYPWWWTDEYRTPLEEGERIVYDEEESQLVRKFGLKPEQIKFRRMAIEELGFEFKQEYPEDIYTCFLHSGLGYFGNIDPYFDAPLSPEFDPTHTYVAGLDFGQMVDYTAFYIYDVTVRQFVDLLHVHQQDWPDMRAEIRRYIRKWNVKHVRAETNSMGRSEISSLRAECEAEGLDATIFGFEMTSSSKPRLMRMYRQAMHEDGVRHPPIPLVKSEHNAARSKLTPKGWTLESPRDRGMDGRPSGHGDTVIAAALAWYGSMGFQ